MNDKESQDRPALNRRAARGIDRRSRSQISPPPFSTVEGLVEVDRRSHLDRRSSWIRDFFISLGEEGTH